MADHQNAALIVAAAGGTLIGRTRLQKLAYFLEITGLGDGFWFVDYHYGPSSEDLELAVRDATLAGLLEEKEVPTSWGGHYSIYSTKLVDENDTRRAFAKLASETSSVVLELAATAAFLAVEGRDDPWLETARRKPDKAADGRLEKARALYREFVRLQSPKPLPNTVDAN